MTSINKKKKARNSYTEDALKFGKRRCKRICFFDSSQRKKNNDINE